MTHCYKTSWEPKTAYFSKREPTREKVIATYMSHYRNRLLLDRLRLSTADLAETYQIEQEIKICDRKLDYWSRHGLFTIDRETMTKMSQLKAAIAKVNF